MLGKTAGGLYWMFRYLERAENTSRLVETGFRIAQTRPSQDGNDWQSVVQTAGVDFGYRQKHDEYNAKNVIDYLLRDPDNSSSVIAGLEAARTNARMVRTALTREVWEAVNNTWLTLSETMKRPINERDLITVLDVIRRETTIVRGALHGSMLRNDIYDFCRLGTYVERGDNTARILDVKYYVLLPTVSHVGSALDNTQWETILRALSANRSFRWLKQGQVTAEAIAEFLIFDRSMPRSLRFSCGEIVKHLEYLEDKQDSSSTLVIARNLKAHLDETDISNVFATGLHEYLDRFTQTINALGQEIEREYRFYG